MKKVLSVMLAALMLVSCFALASCGGNDDKLVVYTEAGFAPYEFYYNNEIVGVDIEIAKLVAEKMGKTLQLEDVNFDTICGAVKTGKADMGIAGIGAAQATAAGRVADSAKIGRNASTIALIQDKTPEEVEADGVECGNKKLRVILNRNGMQHAQGEYIDLQFNGNLISYEEAKQHIPQTPY